MANPQLENGFTRIANEIIEALMKTQLSGYQSRILWAIFRKTYGYNKKTDWISLSQLTKMTNIRLPHASRTVKELMQRNIVTKNGNKIAYQKDYSKWRDLPKMVRVTKNGYKVTKNGYKVTKNGRHKIQYTKDTYTKDMIYIVEYLNEKTKRHFLVSNKNTKKLIRARLGEGRTVDDFKTVIDKKVNDWLEDTKMSKYLRPETLFNATKFENYLNEPDKMETRVYFDNEPTTPP